MHWRNWMNKFWDKVEKCKHRNTYPDYCVSLPCICGSIEVHCKDCGVFFTTLCRCGEMVGMSGWPYARWKKLDD